MISLYLILKRSQSSKRRKILRKKIVTYDVVVTLDNTIVMYYLQSLGKHLLDISISSSTIQRGRKCLRAKIANKLKEDFSATVSLAVPLDGKLLSE